MKLYQFYCLMVLIQTLKMKMKGLLFTMQHQEDVMKLYQFYCLMVLIQALKI
uniref:Uncharacterized protein n=1 Tax=Amphimedon queenslandica TaxID=400682 RepID=A0A1X7SNA9_AMPQE